MSVAHQLVIQVARSAGPIPDPARSYSPRTPRSRQQGRSRLTSPPSDRTITQDQPRRGLRAWGLIVEGWGQTEWFSGISERSLQEKRRYSGCANMHGCGALKDWQLHAALCLEGANCPLANRLPACCRLRCPTRSRSADSGRHPGSRRFVLGLASGEQLAISSRPNRGLRPGTPPAASTTWLPNRIPA